MPNIPNANPTAPVYMLAEKGSAILLNRWGAKNKNRNETHVSLKSW
jgi:hypothetical protein